MCNNKTPKFTWHSLVICLRVTSFVVVVLEIVIIAVLFFVSYILNINDPKNEIFRRIKTKERQP